MYYTELYDYKGMKFYVPLNRRKPAVEVSPQQLQKEREEATSLFSDGK